MVNHPSPLPPLPAQLYFLMATVPPPQKKQHFTAEWGSRGGVVEKEGERRNFFISSSSTPLFLGLGRCFPICVGGGQAFTVPLSPTTTLAFRAVRRVHFCCGSRSSKWGLSTTLREVRVTYARERIRGRMGREERGPSLSLPWPPPHMSQYQPHCLRQ